MCELKKEGRTNPSEQRGCLCFPRQVPTGDTAAREENWPQFITSHFFLQRSISRKARVSLWHCFHWPINSIKGKSSNSLCVVCETFICFSSIFNLGQVKFKYLVNHAILKMNANRHRLITISWGGSIYEMPLKIVYPQANRCQPSFRLNVSFAVNTETERYGFGAGS